MSSREPESLRVLVIDTDGRWAPSGAVVRANPSPAELARAEVVIFGSSRRDAADQLARWRVAGHRFGAVLLGRLDEGTDRARLEPLLVLPKPPAEGWEKALSSLRGGASAAEQLRLGARTVDLGRRVVSGPEGVEALSARECELLAYLAARPGRDVSRDELQLQVWRNATVTVSRAVDMAVARLRKKLEDEPATPRWLLSSRGDGYRLCMDPIPAPEPAPTPRIGISRAPAPTGRLYGREGALAALAEAVDRGERLLTLLGPPGAGKTALAAALARDPGPRKAVWVELASVRDGDGVRLAVASALGVETVQLRTAADLEARLLTALEVLGETLVVLDNAEHVVEHVAGLVAGWTRADLGARLLVTSQVRLGLRGERCVDVPPLNPEDAAALFLDRAAAVGAPPPDDQDDEALQQVLAALDYLPLGLELAAARTRALSLPQLAAALADRLGALRRGPRDSPGRHSSLRAAVAWSWGLLSPAEQDALAQLSVFEGPFDLTKAREVLDPSGWPAGMDALDLVEALLDRSLISRTEPGEEREARYHLLSSVRAFASEQASATGEALRARHRAACVRRAVRLLAFNEREEATRLARRLWAEAADWRAAMVGACDDDAAALALGLDALYGLRGTTEQRVAVIEAALAVVHAPQARARLRIFRARARLLHTPDAEAEADLREAAMVYESLGMIPEIGLAVSILGDLLSRRGDMAGAYEATSRWTPLLSEAAPDIAFKVRADAAYFWIVLNGGAPGVEERVTSLRQALSRAVADGRLRSAYRHAIQLGIVLEELGDARGASAARAEALHNAERLQAPTMMGGASLHVALDAVTARDYPEARRRLARALQITQQAGDRSRLPYVRYHILSCELQAGVDCRARFEAELDVAEASGERRVAAYLRLGLALEALTRRATGDARAWIREAEERAHALGLRPVIGATGLANAVADLWDGLPAGDTLQAISQDQALTAEERALAAALAWARGAPDGEGRTLAWATLSGLVERGSWPDQPTFRALLTAWKAGEPAAGLDVLRRSPTSVAVRLLMLALSEPRATG